MSFLPRSTKLTSSTHPSTARADSSPFLPGRSRWVRSPVTTNFDPKPSLVRNIFIWSGVVFWASSRITNASFMVRPRMNASGAISMMPCSMRALPFSMSVMSNSASYSGRTYGSSFSCSVPGR